MNSLLLAAGKFIGYPVDVERWQSMWVSKITKENLTDDIIDGLLFEDLNDNGASVDCIIVLGSMKAAKYRVPAAAKAFFSGRSEKIMLCGGKTRNFSGESMAEADNM